MWNVKLNKNILLSIEIVLACIFILNWAIASAYSGLGFMVYGLVNGLIVAVILFLTIKKRS